MHGITETILATTDSYACELVSPNCEVFAIVTEHTDCSIAGVLVDCCTHDVLECSLVDS